MPGPPPTIENVTFVPSGAFTNVPVPVSCLTVAVNVCDVPTSFVAVNGLIEILASTKVLTTGPLPPWPALMVVVAGLVSRVNESPPTVSLTVALPVTWPALGLLKVIVH